MRPTPTMANRRTAGFTLVELMISASLMVLILAAAYVCLRAGLSAQRLIDPRLDATQTARVALALLTADLRAACPLDRSTEFIGIDRTLGGIEADNLDFATHNHTPRRPGEGDFCQTSYFLDQDRASGDLILWRRRNPRIGLDPLVGGVREEIARGVRQLKFEFYDGFEWYDTWGDPENRDRQTPKTPSLLQPNLSGLPAAVRITLALAASRDRRPAGAASATEATPRSPTEPSDGEPPLVFQTVAHLVVPASASASGFPSAGGPASAPNPSAPPSAD